MSEQAKYDMRHIQVKIGDQVIEGFDPPRPPELSEELQQEIRERTRRMLTQMLFPANPEGERQDD